MARVCGIDEAGRGPVIGPMVIAAVMAEDSEDSLMKQMGTRDSKQLSPHGREKVYLGLVRRFRHKVAIVSPEEIDAAVLSKATNLNWLEAEHSAMLAKELMPDKVIIDCPSPNLEAYKVRLKKLLPSCIEILALHKADQKYAIVGAASIIAKVTRDRIIEELKARYGIEFGSGYPSDPRTVNFLRGNHGKYDFFRRSWESYRKLAGQSGQSSLDSFE